MIAGTLLGFAVAVFVLAGVGALLRRNNKTVDARIERILGDDRKLAAGVVAQAISEAVIAGKHPVAYRVLNHPSGDVIDVICAEDAYENAEAILREEA